MTDAGLMSLYPGAAIAMGGNGHEVHAPPTVVRGTMEAGDYRNPKIDKLLVVDGIDEGAMTAVKHGKYGTGRRCF